MTLLFLALLADWYIGDPDRVWRSIPHPVVLFGKIIDAFDTYRRRHNQDFLYGILLLFFFVLLSLFITLFLFFLWRPLSLLLEFLLLFSLLAQRSLYDHVHCVYESLCTGDLIQARLNVAKIVGRDISQASESDVSAASIESLSENYVDGILAPVFFYCVFGIFGILFYKMVNTCDSMIGKRNSDYEFFGKPSARLDDILNYIPARLSIFLIGFVSQFLRGYSSFVIVLETSLRDGSNHPSVNAGYPQSAFASSLDICLGNSRTYGDISVSFPSFNESGRSQLSSLDIFRSLYLFRFCCYLVIFIIFLFYIFL